MKSHDIKVKFSSKHDFNYNEDITKHYELWKRIEHFPSGIGTHSFDACTALPSKRFCEKLLEDAWDIITLVGLKLYTMENKANLIESFIFHNEDEDIEFAVIKATNKIAVFVLKEEL